jgi:predicted ATP-grasp superfamily ATP-dependent carboligase
MEGACTMIYQPHFSKKCVIVFSGFNQRSVVAFLRTMTQYGVEYAVIAKSKEDTILFSEYKNKVLAIRKTSQLVLEDMLSAIQEVQRRHFADEYVVAPSSEALNRFLLKHKQVFSEYRCQIPLVDSDIYELISNKHSFAQLCINNNILVPKEECFSLDMRLPIVAKPKKYFSQITGESLSPQILNTCDDLKMFCDQHYIDDFYFQEFINGKSLYLLYCFTHSGKVVKFSQENIIQQACGKSMIYANSSDFHQSDESLKYEAMFRKASFWGLVMVEIKQRDSQNFMIEANPRFWGPSQLFVDAGINLFGVWLYDIGILGSMPPLEKNNNDTRYFWFGGVVDTYRKGQELTFHRNDEMQLMASLPSYLQFDIYRRPDTMGIFKKELTDGHI